MSNRALTLVGCILTISCNSSGITGDVPQPVSVSVAFWNQTLEVGTVSRVCAFGMASWGLAVATHRVESWTLADPTLASIGEMPDPADRYACILLRPLRPGVLTLTARMAGIEGTSSIRLIPQIRTILLSPSTLTLRVGDTASIRSTVITVDGDTLRGIPLVWRESDFGVVAAAMFYGTGPPASTVALAKAVGENTITMQVATSRQDSASNARGTVGITVLPSTSAP
jgi:hypothetical protein